MKKSIALLLALALLVPMVLSTSAHSDNAFLGAVNNYEGTIALDGVKETAYEDYGRHFVADAYEYIKGEPKEGFSANFWWLFSNEYKELHIFTEIVDPVLLMPGDANHADISKCNHVDCVEIWIDPTNEVVGFIKDDDLISREAFHYRCDYSGFNSGTMWGNYCLGNTACAPYFDTVVTPNAGGYTIEWVIYTDVYEQFGLTTLEKGDDWGIQMMGKNVFDTCHYQYEQEESGHRWDTSIYAMNSFTMKTDMSGNDADYNTADFDFIKLGNSVSDGEDPIDDPDDTDPVDPTDDTTAPVDPQETTAPQDPTNPDETNAGDDPADTKNPDETTVPGGTEKDPDQPGETIAGGDTPEDNPTRPVRPAGDTLAVAVIALLLSAGAAIVVSKKRR